MERDAPKPPARAALLLAEAGLVTHALFAPLSIAGTQIGLGVAAAGLALAALTGFRPKRTPLDLPALAFVLACLLSEVFADGGAPDLGHATLWRSLLGFFVVFHALSLVPDAGRTARRIVAALSAGLVFAGALGVYQYFTGFDALLWAGLHKTLAQVPAPGVPGRYGAMGLFTSRLTFGHVVLVLLALLGGAVLSGAVRGRLRALAVATCALGLAALVLTFDRAAFLGLAVSAAALGAGFALRGRPRAAGNAAPWKRSALALASALGLALAALAAFPPARARLASSLSLAQNADRVFLWSRALEIIRDHPLTGVGFGNYHNVCSRYYDRVDPSFFMRTWAHCSPLSLLAETGPLGLLAALWLGVAAVRALSAKLREGAPYALGALAAIAGLFTAGLVHDLIYDTKVMYPLWLAVALGMSQAWAPPREASGGPAKPRGPEAVEGAPQRAPG
jgi:O-antigen ligase